MYIDAHCLFLLLFLSIISTAYHLLSGSRAARLLLKWLIDWSWRLTVGKRVERKEMSRGPGGRLVGVGANSRTAAVRAAGAAVEWRRQAVPTAGHTTKSPDHLAAAARATRVTRHRRYVTVSSQQHASRHHRVRTANRCNPASIARQHPSG